MQNARAKKKRLSPCPPSVQAVQRISAVLPPLCRFAPPPGPGTHPAQGCLQHAHQSRQKQSASFESPILQPLSSKNPTWKLQILSWGQFISCLHNLERWSLAQQPLQLTFLWAGDDPIEHPSPHSSSTVENQVTGRGDPLPPNSQQQQAPSSSLRDWMLCASAGTLLGGFDICWWRIFLSNQALLQSWTGQL